MSFKRINSVVLPHVNKSIFTCAVVILGFIAAGCSNIKNSFKEESPRDKYEQMISKAGILNTSMGKSWKEMGEKSLFDSLSILLPFREDGYFFTEKTDAISYRFKARRGEKISISVTTDSIRHLALFMDLFSVNVSSNVPERTAFAGNNRELSILYPVKKDQTLILRLQPELLNGGRYTLIIKTLPSLVFPIRDKHGDAIGGLFGDSRDGGHRRHEGVDIFAKKGTPVVSASDGIVTRTGEDNLGGKIIMISNLRNESFYYAHLDSQLVNVGTYIKAGEIIGLVGNTGNAKYT
ncbi:MAG: M23 family metallopeptidase, partial [Ignavibacteriales bacterium]